MTENTLKINKAFKTDVALGLNSNPKKLPSKYFYDKIGDELFVKIMNMPEYYLTRAEHEIFKQQAPAIINSFGFNTNEFFELIELGAGDGTKTKELLKALNKENYQYEYIPIDISKNTLEKLKANLVKELPEVTVAPKHGTYFNVLSDLKETKHPKVVLFLGSNIGNLEDTKAKSFIAKLSEALQVNDCLLLGVDLMKDKEIILPAYNDAQGITSAFNLNLLHRINNELGGNFDVNAFEHKPEYDEKTGVAESYLVSAKSQTVTIQALNETYTFEAGERIHTEISRKYNDKVLDAILKESNLEIEHKFIDTKGYFADYILKKK